jgi:hypothetical protein
MTEADMYTARIVTLMLAVFLWQPVAHADLDDIRRIAEAGDREAQLELGILFQYGFNFKDNEIPALTWYSLSANQGNVRAQKLRDVLKAKMTEKEVQEAMEQVASFKPKGVARTAPVPATAPAVSPLPDTPPAAPAPEPQAAVVEPLAVPEIAPLPPAAP